MADEPSSRMMRTRLILLGLALVTLVFAVYGRSASHEFVDYDDPAYITENPHVRQGLSLETVTWAFTTGYHSNWHPLTWLSHALDCSVFGVDPTGHHLVSVALHALNAVLLLLALRRMTQATWRSAVVAALFAVHPLRVESVVWAAERKDVLSTLFWMLVLLAHARHVARPTRTTRVLLPLLLGLGLLAKPMLVTLPFALLLLDFWPLRRLGFGARGGATRQVPPLALVREKLPLFGLAAVSSLITYVVQQRGGAVTPLEGLPFGARLENAVVGYATYLVRLVWPAGLGVLYPLDSSLPGWKVVAACGVLVAITAAALRAARRAPYWTTGWLWYLGTLFPVIGVVQVGLQSTADRYTYVPSIGVFVMLVWGAADLVGTSRYGRFALGTSALLAVVVCSVLAWQQAGAWRDSVTLFERTLAVTSENYVVHNNLGAVFLREGRRDRAIPHFQQALRIRPDYVSALSNLGLAVQGEGRLREAINHYREALRLKPSHVEAWLNLGNALGQIGDLDGALAAFREAARLSPEDPEIAAAVRTVEERRKQAPIGSGRPEGPPPEALSAFDRANALRDEGRLAEAEASYREAIRLAPGFALAHNNLGSVLGRQGRGEEAIAAISRALEIDPELPPAHNNMGIALAMRGETERAARHFSEVLRLDPRDSTAHFNLGALLARQGRVEEAIPHFEEALRIHPGYESARRALVEARRSEAGAVGR